LDGFDWRALITLGAIEARSMTVRLGISTSGYLDDGGMNFA
jgi:hypothetical protein